MAVIEVKTGKISESSMPSHIMEQVIRTKIALESAKDQENHDLQLLLNSKLPEIGALCRLLNITDEKSTR